MFVNIFLMAADLSECRRSTFKSSESKSDKKNTTPATSNLLQIMATAATCLSNENCSTRSLLFTWRSLFLHFPVAAFSHYVKKRGIICESVSVNTHAHIYFINTVKWVSINTEQCINCSWYRKQNNTNNINDIDDIDNDDVKYKFNARKSRKPRQTIPPAVYSLYKARRADRVHVCVATSLFFWYCLPIEKWHHLSSKNLISLSRIQ